MYEKVMFELIKEKGFKINNIVKKLWMKESDILYLKKMWTCYRAAFI